MYLFLLSLTEQKTNLYITQWPFQQTHKEYTCKIHLMGFGALNLETLLSEERG